MLHASYVHDKITQTWADLRLHHPESGRHRSVVYDGLWTVYRFRHLLDVALPARIVELTIETGLFPMAASLFPSLPALHTLVFVGSLSSSYFVRDNGDGEDSEDGESEDDARGVVEGGDGSEDDTDSESESDSNADVIGHQQLPRITASGLPYLSCSSLAKLVLATRTGDPDVTRVDTLVTFMGDVLSQTAPGTVELELRNVTLVGDISRLSGFFSRVVTFPEPFEFPDLQGDRCKAY
ncbi:hypothetical protein EXIGLDRAFT_775649 [Exidia glandulosa HHB12029]|uniref:Uncharacterized protein n=1 Tax=Exidia glandulosa HHB12029 TaxID=1314781 RepID=A0A165DU14_EXIGL|nr:hypothetical protein EXIGLDRAFT_775649 [Exidia glandulosa HHB12029]